MLFFGIIGFFIALGIGVSCIVLMVMGLIKLSMKWFPEAFK